LIEIGISVVGKKSGQLQHPLAIMQNKPKKNMDHDFLNKLKRLTGSSN